MIYAIAFIFGMVIGTSEGSRHACERAPKAQHSRMDCPK